MRVLQTAAMSVLLRGNLIEYVKIGLEGGGRISLTHLKVSELTFQCSILPFLVFHNLLLEFFHMPI